jgi:hypothetical protein
MKALVVGWFSFEGMGATAGDLFARDLACDWLGQAGLAPDVATAKPFTGGVDWRCASPGAYSHLVFVCGPFGNGWPVTELLERFSACRLVGLDLSMLEPLDVWNPFDLLLERDSSAAARPDITFLSPERRVPVVGVVLVHPQAEYPNAAHDRANEAIGRLIAAHEMAAVPIDTRLDVNSTGLRSPHEVESLIARMDVVITTRLHGLVLALKNGVPALAVDPIAGGAKVRRQAETIGWPVLCTADAVSDAELSSAFAYCSSDEARSLAQKVRQRAAEQVRDVQEQFITALAASGGIPRG